jgi:hypothetical protein
MEELMFAFRLFIILFLSTLASQSFAVEQSPQEPEFSLALNPIINIRDAPFRGVAISLGNFFEKKSSGFATGGVFNIFEDDFDGLALTGGVNFTSGNHRGAQLSAMLNMTGKTHTGTQLSPFANLTFGAMNGWQGSVIFNYAGKGSNLFQTSVVNLIGGGEKFYQVGLLNISFDENLKKTFSTPRGMQEFALQFGVINFSLEKVSTQFGYFNLANSVSQQMGIINVARHVTGFQLGWINLSHSSNGFALGMFSLSMKNGGISYEGWVDSSLNSYSSIKFRHTYTYSAIVFNTTLLNSYDFNNPDKGVGYIYGFHYAKKKLYFEIDFGGVPIKNDRISRDKSLACENDFICTNNVDRTGDIQFELKAKVGYKLLDHFFVTAGVGHNFSNENSFIMCGFSISQ